MKKSNVIILAASLFFGFASTTYATNLYSSYVGQNNQSVNEHRVLDSAETALKNSEVLLMNSWAKRKLISSGNEMDKARFEEAKKIRREAIKAFHAGNEIQAKHLALESIRVIASSVSRYNVRVALANDGNQ